MRSEANLKRSSIVEESIKKIRYRWVKTKEEPALIFLPKPSGAPHAAGVPMDRFANRRFEYRRENITGQFGWKIGVELVHIGHAASYNKNVRIESIDHRGQSACDTADVPMPDQASKAISVPHFHNNFGCGQIGWSMAGVVGLERPP